MKAKRHLLFAGLTAAAIHFAHAQDAFLSLNGLVAYYDFEQTGTGGLENQAPGFAGQHDGAYLGDVSLIAGAGAGFSGDATYAGTVATNTTDRSNLLVGNALNVAKANTSAAAGKGQFSVTSLGTASLGGDFTVSSWFYLAQDADNTGTSGDIIRNSVFEASNNFNVSWGTGVNNNTYTPYLGSSAGPSSVLAQNQWHHVTQSFSDDGVTSILNVYVNGALQATVTGASGAVNFSGLNFGAHRSGGRIFDGLLDEVNVWDRSLTGSDVFAMYNLGQSGQALTTNITSHIKEDNTTNLNFGGAWDTGVAPGTSDYLIFGGGFTQAGALDTGAAMEVAGLRVAGGSGLVDLDNTSGTLTLGSLGLDMAGATRDLRVADLAAGADQNWNIAAGRTLTLDSMSGSGEITQLGGGTLLLAGSNDHTGTLRVNNGITTLAAPSAVPSVGSIDVASGSTLALRFGAGAFDEVALSNLMDDNLAGVNMAADAIAGVDTHNGAVTIGNDLSGTRGLSIFGGGSLSLAGNNTYSGATRILDADVAVADGATLGGTGAIFLSTAGSLTFNNTADLNLGRAITGGGTLVHQGSGELRTGASGNNFDLDVASGTFRVAEGAWAVSYFSTAGREITVRDGATLLNTGSHALGGLGGAFFRPKITIEQGGTWQLNNEQYMNAGDITLTGGTILQTASGLRLQGGTMLVGASDTGSLISRTGSGNVTLFADPTFDVASGAAAVDFEISAPISQSGVRGFTKTGDGLMVVSANNTYTGTTTISGGTLQVGNGGTTGSLGSGGIVNNASLVINSGDATAVANDISGSGSLAMTGSGLLTFSGNNNYSGGTTASSGGVVAGANTAFGTGAVVVNGASFESAPGVEIANNLTLSGGATARVAESTGLGSGTVTLNGASVLVGNGVELSNEIVLQGSASSNVLNGTIEIDYLVVGGGGGGGGRDASGGGGGGGVMSNLLSLSSGLPVASGEALQLTVGGGGAGGGVSSAGGAAGQGTNGENSSLGSILALGGGGGGSYNTAGKAGASGGGGGRVNGGGTGTAGQGFDGGSGSGGTITGASTADAAAGGGGAGTAGANGVAGSSNGGGKGGDGLALGFLTPSLASNLGIGEVSGGDVYFSGGGGGTPHRNGTNVPSGDGGLGGGGAGSINNTSTFATPGTANTGGGGGASRSDNASRGIGGQGGSGVVLVRYAGGPIATGGDDTRTDGGYTYHTFTGNGASALEFGAFTGTSDATISGTMTGTGGFTWNSTGTLTLAAANTHGGDTIISGGTLALGSSGSISNSSVVLNGGAFNISAVSGGYTIESGTSLSGSGSVSGNLTINGTLAIGSSPGTMNFAGDLGLNGIADFEITNPALTLGSYDLANGTGTVNFGGVLNLFFSGGAYTDTTFVQLFDFDGGYSGDFTSVTFSGLGAGQSATFNSASGFVTVIPEPAAALLGGLGFLVLLLRRRI